MEASSCNPPIIVVQMPYWKTKKALGYRRGILEARPWSFKFPVQLAPLYTSFSVRGVKAPGCMEGRAAVQGMHELQGV